MSKDNSVSISENELNSVLNSVKDVNTKNLQEDYKLGVGISKAELEKVLKGSSLSEDASESIVKSEYEKKIAKRRAHAAEVLEKMNASLPRTISVIYGSATKDASFVAGLKQGDSISLDRLSDQTADIFVNGSLFARGMLEVCDGHASVKIVDIVSEQS